jgi:hypothetical protein
MRVYIGSGLREDKKSTFCVHRLYYDCLDRNPLYPSFYRRRGGGGRVCMKDPVGYDNTRLRLYLYFPHLQDLTL